MRASGLIVKSPFLDRLYLDPKSFLLSARAVQMVRLFFETINVRGTGSLDDVQMYCLFNTTTNMTDNQIDAVFDTFDLDGDGTIDFDEFYLLIAILLAVKNNQQKQFLYRHARTCFELLDADGNGTISKESLKPWVSSLDTLIELSDKFFTSLISL
ncbi:hypothetical protein GEMRC1_011901 [Eukaryota sp. GEM-RC1]